MNRFAIAAATCLIALTSTAFAADMRPQASMNNVGKKCEDLYGIQRKRCMGATILQHFEQKMERKINRLEHKITRKSTSSAAAPAVVRGNRRAIKEMERERQRKFRMEEMIKKDKAMQEWMKMHPSSSSSSVSSTGSSSSAMSSSSTSSASSASSATSSSSSAQ